MDLEGHSFLHYSFALDYNCLGDQNDILRFSSSLFFYTYELKFLLLAKHYVAQFCIFTKNSYICSSSIYFRNH